MPRFAGRDLLRDDEAMQFATIGLGIVLLVTMSSAAPKTTSAPTLPAELCSRDAKVEKLVGGLKFTEGPVWVKDEFGNGRLIFSDIDGNQLKAWTAGGMVLSALP